MAAVLMALTAACAWGCSDFLGGLTSRRLGSALAVVFVSQCVALLFVIVVVIVGGRGYPDAESVGYAMLAGIGEAVGLGAFYRGLAVGVMGVVAPIAATCGVVPVAVGLAAGESPNALAAAGIPLALIGVGLVAWVPGGVGNAQWRIATGVGLALLAAAGFGGFLVAIHAASDRAHFTWVVFVDRVTLVAFVGLAVAMMRPRLSAGVSAVPALAAIGVLDTGGTTLYAAAASQGLLVIVGLLGALYPIMTILLARLLLKERLSASQRVGTAIGLIGVAMMGVKAG